MNKIVVAYPVGIHSDQELLNYGDLFQLVLHVHRRLTALFGEGMAEEFANNCLHSCGTRGAVAVMKQYVDFQ